MPADVKASEGTLIWKAAPTAILMAWTKIDVSLKNSIIERMGRIARWHTIIKIKVRREPPPGALPSAAYHPAGGDISGARLGVASLGVLAQRQGNAVNGRSHIYSDRRWVRRAISDKGP